MLLTKTDAPFSGTNANFKTRHVFPFVRYHSNTRKTPRTLKSAHAFKYKCIRTLKGNIANKANKERLVKWLIRVYNQILVCDMKSDTIEFLPRGYIRFGVKNWFLRLAPGWNKCVFLTGTGKMRIKHRIQQILPFHAHWVKGVLVRFHFYSNNLNVVPKA